MAESEEIGMHSSHKRSVTVESSIVIAEGSSSYGSKRDSFLAEAWRLASTSKRAMGIPVSAVESSGVVFNFPTQGHHPHNSHDFPRLFMSKF